LRWGFHNGRRNLKDRACTGSTKPAFVSLGTPFILERPASPPFAIAVPDLLTQFQKIDAAAPNCCRFRGKLSRAIARFGPRSLLPDGFRRN
jgi:hypothetical protein